MTNYDNFVTKVCEYFLVGIGMFMLFLIPLMITSSGIEEFYELSIHSLVFLICLQLLCTSLGIVWIIVTCMAIQYSKIKQTQVQIQSQIKELSK